MEVEHCTSKSDHPVLCGPVYVDNVPTMSANHTKLLDMLVFSPAFTIDPLLALELFCHSGIANCGFTSTTEVEPVEGEHGAMVQTLCNQSAH
jgi:hypothetical protein